MIKEYDKKVFRLTGGRYTYDETNVNTREEANTIAQEKAAGNYEQVQIWELVGTVQNKMPTDLIITPIA